MFEVNFAIKLAASRCEMNGSMSLSAVLLGLLCKKKRP